MNERIKEGFLLVPRTLVFIQNHFKAVVFSTVVVALLWPSGDAPLDEANLARLDVTGPIMDASHFMEQIKHIEESPNIKGVLLYVDSPGGAVAPSVEMSMAVKRLATKLPVVTYVGGTMASGSLYASIYSPLIIANPGSMIGSIGVVFEGANIEGLMEKLGVKSQVVKMGTYKEAGTPLREWTPQERGELERLLGATYAMFVSDVAKARHLDLSKAQEFADAHVFTAMEAKQKGLVDRLGSFYDAQDELAHRAKIEKAVWEEKSDFDKFMDKMAQHAITEVVTHFTGLKAY